MARTQAEQRMREQNERLLNDGGSAVGEGSALGFSLAI